MKNKNKDITPVYARMAKKTYEERYPELQCGQFREYDASVGVYFPEDMPAKNLVAEVFPSVLLSLAIKAAGTDETAQDPKAERLRTAQEIRSRAAREPGIRDMTLHEIKKLMQQLAKNIKSEKEYRALDDFDNVIADVIFFAEEEHEKKDEEKTENATGKNKKRQASDK